MIKKKVFNVKANWANSEVLAGSKRTRGSNARGPSDRQPFGLKKKNRPPNEGLTRGFPWHPSAGPGGRLTGEEVHMPEGVDGDDGQVLLALAEVVERVGELLAVRRQEVHVLWKGEREVTGRSLAARVAFHDAAVLTLLVGELRLDELVVALDDVRVARLVEQDQERQTLLRQLLRVLQ